MTTLLMFLLLANTFIALTSIRPALSNPTILTVPNPYSTIHAALAAAGTGDTIEVAAGVYHESNLVITQNELTLQGESSANTIIDGQNSNNPIINVNANGVTIRSFTVRNAGAAYGAFGVFLNYHSTGTCLSGNAFSGCYFSVRAQNSTNVTVTSSVFSGDTGFGGAGIYTLYCQTGLIENNSINGTHVGAFIIYSSNFMISNNTFSYCTLTGVTVSYSERNWVVKNRFTFNNSSISIRYNGNNSVIGNTIANSKTAGLLLEEHSPNNVIHHNNFVSNTEQVKFEGSAPPTVWDTSGSIAEGNYWSDYKGTDSGKDGIGDIPYDISTGNARALDSYPLIGPFTDFTVKSQTGTYNVYTISNSNITDFGFNQATKQFEFHVSDTSGTLGICRLVFPSILLGLPYTVYVNDVSQTPGFVRNSTHTALYFSYTHGIQPLNVIIVPEFPSMVIVALLLTLTLLAAVLKRKVHKFSDKAKLI